MAGSRPKPTPLAAALTYHDLRGLPKPTPLAATQIDLDFAWLEL